MVYYLKGMIEVHAMKSVFALVVFVCTILVSCASSVEAQNLQKQEPVQIQEQTQIPVQEPKQEPVQKQVQVKKQEQIKVPAGSLNLNTAIADFSVYMAERRLPESTITAIAVFDTPEQRLGNYITDKLTELLLNDTGLRMVSRQDIERIFDEQIIQAGAFDDDTTARMGRNLGWQTIIYGAIEPLTEAYHLTLRAVDVETGELKGSKSYFLIGNDPILVSLVNPYQTTERLTERESILTPFDGDENNFSLSIGTNKNVFYDGEHLFITLLSNTDCFFVAYHVDTNNTMQVIFPNPWERDMNFLKAGVERVIPENTLYLLHEPFGEERILVYASDQPISIPDEQYSARSISREMIASSREALYRRGLSVEPKGAMAQISYIILPK